MGLDQYALAVTPTAEFTFSPVAIIPKGEEDVESVELAYWRKHPNLQGWMESLYEAKGGEKEFNCEYVMLTGADLDALEEAVKGEDLPDTVGFFYGEDSDDYYREQDLNFIQEARHALAADLLVYYSSWW